RGGRERSMAWSVGLGRTRAAGAAVALNTRGKEGGASGSVRARGSTDRGTVRPQWRSPLDTPRDRLGSGRPRRLLPLQPRSTAIGLVGQAAAPHLHGVPTPWVLATCIGRRREGSRPGHRLRAAPP